MRWLFQGCSNITLASAVNFFIPVTIQSCFCKCLCVYCCIHNLPVILLLKPVDMFNEYLSMLK